MFHFGFYLSIEEKYRFYFLSIMLELKTGVTIVKCYRPLEKFRYDFDLWKIDEFSH